MMGTSSARKSMLFFLELMLFQQFCCGVVGEYQQVQPHLWIRATTFYALPVPLPRQVHVEVFFGVVSYVEKNVEKLVPKGAQRDPKSRPKSIKRVFWRGLERGPQNGTLSRTRKSEILLLFTTLQQGRRSEKRSVFGDHFEDLLGCLLYTSPSPRDRTRSRMPSSA